MVLGNEIASAILADCQLLTWSNNVTFEEAYKELLAGKKIRRKEWNGLNHIRICDGILKSFSGEFVNFNPLPDILPSDGWILVNDDGVELSFIQAIDQLKIGKSVAHKNWKDKFIFVEYDELILAGTVECEFLPITYKCLCANDWEVME